MRDHFAAIREYAKAYAALEKLQHQEKALLPIGDQKTGVIAEFYARLYAVDQYPGAEHLYGTPSQHAWDITVRRPLVADHKIQVKAVSAYSKTSRISPIHPGWGELYLMRLDDNFHPAGFWTLEASAVTWSGTKLGASTMPPTGSLGSSPFFGAVDRLERLLEVVSNAQA